MFDEEKSDRKWRGFWKDRHDGTRPEIVFSRHHVTQKGRTLSALRGMEAETQRYSSSLVDHPSFVSCMMR